ncbi:hypothetical protein EGV01_30195 [Pseudomonas syringae pv. theae]|nr:hypothetical protein [Pseudomonas syringae pv. theae]MBL3837901.1 hypothetical protein [Pseudomonas syringae pv. theae]MBL3876080.1 hypothetical protein [Pseudomonas syringae pv. theae]
MIKSLGDQHATPDINDLSFDERFGLMVDRELTEREDARLTTRLKAARLRHNACLEDIDYRGRGLIQITGRANYAACGEALGLDLLKHPELLERPEHAAMSAGWFWHRAGLNTFADKSDFLTITKRINGGTNGLADRQALYERALKTLP